MQYLNGLVPLNLDALIKFSLALKVPITEISPSLSSRILAVQSVMDAGAFGVSAGGLDIARAFDRLANQAQKDAVVAQLRAFGAL
jgi:hypothetical protein